MKEYNYKKKVIKMLIILSCSIVSIVCIIFYEANNNSIGSTLFALTAGILIPYLIPSIVELGDNKNWKTSQRKLKRAGLLHNDTIVRISFAYLFRIKIDGHYFLIENNRTKKYQPVGGTYKFNEDEAKYLSAHIPVENDDRIPVDKITKLDYRLLVKSKDLRRFVKRFDKTSNRENINDLSREFSEELFSSNILDRGSFGILNYNYCGRHMTEVKYGNVFNHYELLLADIIELQLSVEQETLFRNLKKKNYSKYCFVKSNEIKSHGVGFGTNVHEDNIANHTPKILSGNSDDLIMRNKHQQLFMVKP